MKNAKIITYEELIASPNSDNQKSVLVGGCFDIFHYGHLTFLKEAKKEGSSLIVALESDEFIIKKKKQKPFHTQDQRAALLAEFAFVDRIILLPPLNSDAEYLNLVRLVKPAVIVVTEGDSQLGNKKKHASQIGAVVKTVDLLPTFSSTTLRPYAALSRD